MGEKIYLLLLFVAELVTSVPLSPALQLSVSGLNEYEKSFDGIKKIARPDSDIKEAEEPEGIFSKIIKANKGNTMPVRDGDIMITPGRSAINCTKCLWPKSADGTVNVPYNLSSDYNDWQHYLFKIAMAEYESLTCIRFVNWTDQKDYINIVSGRGCAGYVGRVGGGQSVSVSTAGCINFGIIQHELNHALGFYHEHMRSDRDDYVNIMYQYISPGDTPNFDKIDTNNLGLEYDYGSVMHYDKWSFSNTSGQPTIVPKPDPNVEIGQRYGMSVLDVSKINKLYQCDVCSNLLYNNNGTLTSANYPSAYSNNANCVWLIRTQSNQVTLNFVAFDIQSSPNCMSDYIRIYDGPTKNYPLILDRTCGSGLVPPIIASTSQLLVEFSSDSSVTGAGFKASYSTVNCGGTYYTLERNVTSPNYPNNYGPNMYCIFTVTAPVGKKVSMTFVEFHLESFPYCGCDSLRVTDGVNPQGPFCGESIPNFISAGNFLQLTFISDGSTDLKGFLAEYTFI
ncbi:embryonic protein UVS.2-like isoform X2 [Eleutherodactylus coqui]|uniref:embryonic protein UVS.2-like isoform X2 n=1 Tax=Eleutherodactylus coqui TaxID=57060 RepID=UPI00346377D7